jgi:hypothetical protein
MLYRFVTLYVPAKKVFYVALAMVEISKSRERVNGWPPT